jgi:PPOX class probable F420-dependent enzyme|tara:strand:- start:6 stop:431 length:426 start_codon:yes stop_codon:yes gene_type:complete
MLSSEVRAFLTESHEAVLATFRANGAAQMSIVTCGPYGEGAAFTTTEGRAKLRNLRRDPRCSLLVSKSDWRGYLVLEGQATVMSPDNTAAEELNAALRDVYRAAAGKEHPDWDEYDEAVLRDSRSAIIVVPEHIYGPVVQG